MSFPKPPFNVSFPKLPFRVLLPLLPIKLLLRSLPVPFRLLLPNNPKFSKFAIRLYLLWNRQYQCLRLRFL
ncbi:hypothetical protein FK216_14985 [Moraxellaceae bacterium AER2_44_116]|nr:hypothetical protein FK216_14985 [Moraxellaceae bacterium AER2_44_116]